MVGFVHTIGVITLKDDSRFTAATPSTRKEGVGFMQETHRQSLIEKLKRHFIYEPPEPEKQFVLPETSEADKARYIQKKALGSVVDRVEDMINGAKSLAEVLEDANARLKSGEMNADEFEKLKIQAEKLENRRRELDPMLLSYQHGNIDIGRQTVSSSLLENKATLSRIYHLPKNMDLQIREFVLKGKLPVNIMLGYIDGMVDKQLLTLSLLQPLMIFEHEKEGLIGEALIDKMVNNLIPHIQAQKITTYKEVTKGINAGDCVIFIDGCGQALQIDVKGYKNRGIGKAEIEKTVRGSQAAFGESLRQNTALLHSVLQSTDFVTEMLPIGKINAKNCAVLYMEGIVNEEAKNELIRRIKGTKRDEIFDAGAFSQMLSENKWQFPENLSTERPDRVVAALMQGRVAMMVEGDPFAYIAPVNLWDFFHNPEDYEMRLPAAVFMRVLRYIGTFLAFILPSVYLSLVTFHYEAIPTEILLAIAGYRQFVPFPSLLELLMMIFAFELIREATLRVPGQLGGSIGIVGAIILGQAAVSAKIVSPLLVVVVAITGLSSYVIPEYRLGFAIRISQYAMLVGASLFGLVGVSMMIVLIVVQLMAIKSLGVPFLTPIIPRTATVSDILRVPSASSANMRRPDELNPKRVQQRPSSYDLWREQEPTQKEDDK